MPILALANPPQISHFQTTLPPENPPWVVRAYYPDRQTLINLAARNEPWEVNREEGYVVVEIMDNMEYLWLVKLGFRLEVDHELTAKYHQPNVRLPGQTTGIPGYHCYRTVEGTYASAENIVENNPTLAEWIDIGDTWEKTQNSDNGYDIMVLRLTNQNIQVEKPKLFAMFAVHAREYTTAELGMRFAEYLIDRYGTNADVTWLLDYHEVHLVLQANPDGRKQAETGLSWRKNTDNNFCSNSNSRGIDLNRNFPFQWGCCNGSSGYECDLTFRGPSATSEPETQAIVNYVSSIFPDLRDSALTSPAPITTTGIFLDVHSYSELVLWPWGFTSSEAPNGEGMQTLGRKFAYFNNYHPEQAVGLYPTDGTTDDFAYGELGLPSYTFELGTAFFQDCVTFDSTILPDNLDALFYALKVVGAPYITPYGPDSLNVNIKAESVDVGQSITLTATINDTRYNNQNGTEPTQNVITAVYYIDVPPIATMPITHYLTSSDGNFDSPIEDVHATINTTDWADGQHTIFVRGQDADGNWGPLSATFLNITTPTIRPVISGYVYDDLDNSPLEAIVTIGAYTTTTNPESGYYTRTVISGTYTMQVESKDYQTVTVTNVHAFNGNTISQDFHLIATRLFTEPFINLSITPAEHVTLAGEIVSYTLTITNLSPTTESYMISIGNHAWQTMPSMTATEPIRPFSATQVIIDVQVPITLSHTQTDTTAIFATSQGTMAYGSHVIITTTAIVTPVPQSIWQQSFKVNDNLVSTTEEITLTTGDNLEITHHVWISHTQQTMFNLQQQWTPELSLLSILTSTGNIITMTDELTEASQLALTWLVPNATPYEWYTFTQTFEVQPSDLYDTYWSAKDLSLALLTQTLQVDDTMPLTHKLTMHLMPMPPTPSPQSIWQQSFKVNDNLVDTTEDITLTTGDNLEITHRVWISHIQQTMFNLQQQWTPELSLLNVLTSTGNIITMTDELTGGSKLALTWLVPNAIPYKWYTFTQTFEAQHGNWQYTHLTQTLHVDDTMPLTKILTIHHTITPNIHMTQTVGLQANTCSTRKTISVTTGTEVFYCYQAQNTGNAALTHHTISESAFDNTLEFSLPLLPGEIEQVIQKHTITQTTINTATWYAENLSFVAIYTDTASVHLLAGQPVNVDLPTVFTNTAGLSMTVFIPSTVLADNTHVVYTPLEPPTMPISDDMHFVGQHFSLQAYQEGELLTDFSFQNPITLTLHYPDTILIDGEMKPIDKLSLMLYKWKNDQWMDSARTCQPPSIHQLGADNTIIAKICGFSDFVLAGHEQKGYAVYLPLVLK